MFLLLSCSMGFLPTEYSSDAALDSGDTGYFLGDPGSVSDETDEDGDGYTVSQGDCNDNNPLISPAAQENCWDPEDNDCDGRTNEQDALNCIDFYRDADGDGYGDQSTSECWCLPGGSTGTFTERTGGDCYDGNPDVHPGQSIFFQAHRGDNSFDYNCDGETEMQYPVMGECAGYDLLGVFDEVCGIDTPGWLSAVPECGQAGQYLADDDSCSPACEVLFIPTCCEESGPSIAPDQMQLCR